MIQYRAGIIQKTHAALGGVCVYPEGLWVAEGTLRRHQEKLLEETAYMLGLDDADGEYVPELDLI